MSIISAQRTTIRTSASLLLVGLTAACGINKDEHERLIGEARARQAKVGNDQLAGQKTACDEDRTKAKREHETVLGKCNVLVAGLEKELAARGGNIDALRSELGQQKAELASTQSTLAATEEEIAQLRRDREAANREVQRLKALELRFKSMVDAGKLEVVMRKGRINLKLADNVLFPSGRANLKKAGRAALIKVGAVLSEVKDRDFLIAGHTDNVAVKRGGALKDNWQVSTARAVTVVRLLTKAGVAPARLIAAGFGEQDPIADNATSSGRARNRRLEIILLPRITGGAM